MIIENTNYGKCIRIWNDGYSDEWAYHIKNVKVLNGCYSEIHPCIQELSKRESKIERKLVLLLFSMENVFRLAYSSKTQDVFDCWENHNRMEFNCWYHDQINELIDEINSISQEYCIIARNDGYGWCY